MSKIIKIIESVLVFFIYPHILLTMSEDTGVLSSLSNFNKRYSSILLHSYLSLVYSGDYQIQLDIV